MAAAVFAGIGSAYFGWHRGSSPTPVRVVAPAPVAPAVAPAVAAVTIGAVDAPATDALVGPRLVVSGWALDPAGIAAVELRTGDVRLPARLAIERLDVAQAKPGYPDSPRAGFEIDVEPARLARAAAMERQPLAIVAIARDGRETVIGRKNLIAPAALQRWSALAASPDAMASPFHVLPALSDVTRGGAAGLERAYAPYLSTTSKIGMRVPLLYLRTTRGEAGDYAFDPDWDVDRRCGDRRIAEDSLAGILAHAVAHRLPVLVTLNGGIWADASCDVPRWDVNDRLEQDPANCQWNESDAVMADDYLKHLPGSQDAPELARALTFNVYAADVRRYKRRNLQAAGRVLAAFAREHPDLFVGASLDPDTYLNPFFDQQQWYDYNPGTLRQFRHWLRGSGPYAGRPDAPEAPDLSAYRRARPLSLAAVGKLAGRRFARWDDVDPPRRFPREPAAGRPAFWDDPWTREWEVFRRHLVDLHYDELSAWLSDAGIRRDRIWSAQGFMAPHPEARPFAIAIDSPTGNYDSGGMSVVGAVPRNGHLGAILYGPAAVNDIRMGGAASLFATFRSADPRWAVIEFNTADLRAPKSRPGYAAGYRGLRDLFNYGARFVSPMAWNGSNGLATGDPGYVTFTAWRNTPLEDATRDFLLSHAGVPLGARLWTFGSVEHADDDGWSATTGTLALQPGRVEVAPSLGRATLVSPRELAFDPAEFDVLVLGVDATAIPASITISARRDPGAHWETIGTAPRARWSHSAAGLAIPLLRPTHRRAFDQLRIELVVAPAATAIALDHVALWPRAISAPRS